MEQNRSRRQAPERSDTEVSEAQIAVHWQEENYFSVPKDFTAQANLTDKGVFKRFALEKFPGYYKEFAELLDWYKKWDKIFDGSKPPFWRWFVGGKINASYNCVDRHLAKHRNKAAIHFVPEPEHEAIQHVTYQELYVRVKDRKSTRLNSSHLVISYAVFCLKKKKEKIDVSLMLSMLQTAAL